MCVMKMTSKGERLKEFVRCLELAELCDHHDRAFGLIAITLTETENKLTDIPNNPDAWRTDGRMYPPRSDSERKSPHPGVRRYRTRKHYVDIGHNGAIRICTVAESVVLIDKPGLDGKKVNDYERQA